MKVWPLFLHQQQKVNRILVYVYEFKAYYHDINTINVL